MIKVNGKEINKKYFPDGTFMLLNIEYPISYSSPFYHINIEWNYENNDEQILLYNIVNHIRDINNYAKITLNLPYVLNARMDRRKSENEIFTLKYFCKFINDLKFDSVKVRDVHSDVSLALLNNVRHETAQLYIEKVINKINPTLLFYPDNGASKKYSELIDFPYLYGIKNRDWKTGKILGLDIIGNIPNNSFDILFVDDIIAYGGSLYYSAKKLKELGANNIYAYITHVENSILDGEVINSGLIKKIYTTQSIFTKNHSLIEII